MARSSVVLIGSAGLENLGNGLGDFVVEVPVRGDVARIGQLVRDVNEVGVHLSQILPHLARREAESLYALWRASIETYTEVRY